MFRTAKKIKFVPDRRRQAFLHLAKVTIKKRFSCLMFIESPANKSEKRGWIEVITGSMFSGKTEELIRRLKRAKIAMQQVEIFKPQMNTGKHRLDLFYLLCASVSLWQHIKSRTTEARRHRAQARLFLFSNRR